MLEICRVPFTGNKKKHIGLIIKVITNTVHFVLKDINLTFFYNVQKVDRLINYLEVNEIKTDNGQVLQTSISHSYHNLNNILLLALCSVLFGRNMWHPMSKAAISHLLWKYSWVHFLIAYPVNKMCWKFEKVWCKISNFMKV